MFVWDLACQRNSLEHGSPRSASHVSAFAPSWAQRKIARRTERREFRRARRLVVEELETIERHLDLLSENRHVPIFDADRMLPTTAWDTYREVLATALADDDWDGLPVVLGTMEQHRRLLMSQPPEPNLQARDYRRSPRARHLLDKHASSSRARSRKQIDPHHSRFRFRHHELSGSTPRACAASMPSGNRTTRRSTDFCGFERCGVRTGYAQSVGQAAKHVGLSRFLRPGPCRRRRSAEAPQAQPRGSTSTRSCRRVRSLIGQARQPEVAPRSIHFPTATRR